MNKENFKKYLINDISNLLQLLQGIDNCTTYDNSINNLAAFSTINSSLKLKEELFRTYVKSMKDVKI
jgi:hypothetical protein